MLTVTSCTTHYTVSCHITIVMLQIAQKNGVLQDWGLVEFNTTEEAEKNRIIL